MNKEVVLLMLSAICMEVNKIKSILPGYKEAYFQASAHGYIFLTSVSLNVEPS